MNDTQTPLEDAKKRPIVKRVVDFATKGIWETPIEDKSAGGRFLLLLCRVVSTSISSALKNRIPKQAASLSYTTLLAIGPLVALVILIAGVFFKDKGEIFIHKKIVEATAFVMPAVNDASLSGSTPEKSRVNPEIIKFINNISKGSGSLGFYGTLTIVVTCLLLCVNMENAFNLVWGVEKGRSWVNRVAFYWLLVTVGTAGVIFGMTFLASAQISGVFKSIPIIGSFSSLGTYLVGFCAMAGLLTCFYKFMPATRVKWSAALAGAVMATVLLVLNNKISFVSTGYIVKQQNFYGFFAIVPIALFSLYLFWLILLSGAQLTYAVQNIDFLSRKQVWNNTSFFAREMVSLGIFAKVCRAFYKNGSNIDLKEIASQIRVPSEILRLCAEDLMEKNLISPVDAFADDDLKRIVLKPAVPPESITLAGFMSAMRGDSNAENAVLRELCGSDSVVERAVFSLAEFAKTPTASTTIKDLIESVKD